MVLFDSFRQKLATTGRAWGGWTVTIYDSIGGAPSVRVVVDKFYGRVLNDPQWAHYFAGVADIDKLKSHQRSSIAAAIGGPEIYQGRDMGAAHATLGITARTSMRS